jgi:hypothetical protein
MHDIALSPLLSPILTAIGLAIGAVVTALAGWAIAEFQARTKILLTTQQIASVHAAADTLAGRAETLLDQKAMSIADIHVDNPVIARLAQEAIDGLGAVATAQGVTPEWMAKTAVGKIDTGVRSVLPDAALLPKMAPKTADISASAAVALADDGGHKS